ncbi:C45 family autoproteolytic acyltransferase/hydolase [Pseudooceanicola nanhaiensis]|uniref:C45 family autoproteolytic acyltransferase/hydolase n=1 Tax=Pseudooceanicola nanhaiensis TaxID=375761 RepID=UPI001CD4E0D1|nr:C45 family peptidase [Pseudooceanicola nanhaiensis]MCA0921416.1 C45 family peptidase [Pseudooceanicola nanhaiensis]
MTSAPTTEGHVAPPPRIEIEGPPEARGRQYGEQAGTLIAHGATFYQGLLEARGLEWGAVMDTARVMLSRLEEVRPVQMTEIRAIAAGAGMDPAEVLLINGRSEVLNAGTIDTKEREITAEDREALDDGCTAGVVLGERTADGVLIHAQNWDWRPECAAFTVVLVVRREDGPDVMTFVEAGGLARAGMNSAGVAITGNNLSIEGESWEKPGIPLSIIRRLALEAEGFSDSLGAVAQSPRSIANNMTLSLSEAEGEIINLETTPAEVFWQVPENGILTHANHFVTEAARAKIRDRGVVEGMNSLYRDRRLRLNLEKAGQKIDVETFKTALADKFGAPRGVLRWPQDSGTNRISATVASIIMKPAERKMWVRQQPYLPGDYAEYSF